MKVMEKKGLYYVCTDEGEAVRGPHTHEHLALAHMLSCVDLEAEQARKGRTIQPARQALAKRQAVRDAKAALLKKRREARRKRQRERLKEARDDGRI